MKKRNVHILEKGEMINDTYEVLFFIGEGAFGEVYRVTHKYLGQQVLKVFKRDYVLNSDIKSVISEAKILSQLNHPNIVRVFETNKFVKNTGTYFFMTTEFISGESLGQLIGREISFSVEKAIAIQLELLMGLATVHAQSPAIIHRDINPDNTLLSYENEKIVVKLCDFGLSQGISQYRGLPDAAGRYTYFAPECFWGTYLPASDVFSAGIVLYRMITGSPPWEYDFGNISDDNDEIMTIVMSGRKKDPLPPSHYVSGCTESLDKIIMKALHKDLEHRYNNASEFLLDINNFHSSLGNTNAKVNPLKAGKNNSQPIHVPKTVKVREKGKGFDEVAGLYEIKEILYNDVILPLSEPELYQTYRVSIPNGLLLFGPPGCGKTYLSKKFSEEIDYHFIELKPSDIASIYVHGTQQKVGEIFKEAQENSPTIIFIDEFDAFVPSRENDLSHSYASEVNEFLVQMTECNEKGIFIIGATNRPDKVEPAVLRTGRLDKVIYLGPPDNDARKELFGLHLKNSPVSSDVDIEELSDSTENYVASDIAFIVNEAARDALKNRTEITQMHIKNAIKRIPPSVSINQIKLYESFKKNRSFG